jgi:16S rRNA (cytosine967-C5)-methyltransferase
VLGEFFAHCRGLTEHLEAACAGYGFVPADRRLLYDLVYTVVRFRPRMRFYLRQLARKGRVPEEPLEFVLEVALAQLLFMERIPDYAALDEAVSEARRLGGKALGGFTNGLLRGLLRARDRGELPQPDLSTVAGLSTWYCLPPWLVQRHLGRLTPQEAETAFVFYLQRPDAPFWFNCHQLHSAGQDGAMLCGELGAVTPHPVVPGAYSSSRAKLELLATAAQARGLIHFQSAASQLLPRLAGVEPGMRVLDACAAPGGKTALLWALAAGDLELHAVERDAGRFRLLRRTLERLGCADDVHLHEADALALEGVLTGDFDLVLLDAPCSSLGVLRTTPEVKWTRRESDLTTYGDEQRALLQACARWVRPGGRLLYSVCSLEPEETTEVVAQFLHTNDVFCQLPLPINGSPVLQAIPDKQPLGYWITPCYSRLDGFFFSILTRKSN